MAKERCFSFHTSDWLRDTRKIGYRIRGLWIDILAIAWNEPKRGIYSRSAKIMEQELGLETEELKSMLLELREVADIQIGKTDITITSRRMVREEERRRVLRIRQDRFRGLMPIETNDIPFDFEGLWKRYPRREGKKMALRHFLATVETEEDWSAINLALDNYLKYLKREMIPGQFIQHGSTWFNNWKDWVDYNGPSTPEIPSLPRYVENIPSSDELVSPKEVQDLVESLGKRPSQ